MNLMINAMQWIWPVCIFIGISFFLLALKRISFSRLSDWASRTEAQWDDILIYAIHRPANILIIVFSLWAAQFFASLPDKVSENIPHCMRFLIIVSVLLFANRFLSRLISVYAQKNSHIQSSKKLFTVLVHSVLGLIFVLVVFSFLGISITPILASLGIGTMAVALALQDTLVNAISGAHLLMDRPISKGDYISLEDDRKQGFVEAIGWRSTRLRLASNDMIVIPNSKLAGSIITNFNRPHEKSLFKVSCGVHYHSDLEKVQSVVMDEAKKIMKEHPQGVHDFVPGVMYNQFSDSSIDFTVTLAAKKFSEHGDLKSEFIKHLHRRFGQEGIVIPYPSRTLYAAADELLGKAK